MPTAFTPSFRGGSGPPLVCLHGFTGTWHMWDLVLPSLTRHHDVLAPTLAGHAAGPSLSDPDNQDAIVDALEAELDNAGFGTAHVVGNSLGGYVAFKLAERGRARSVVALAPAGGWASGDESFRETLRLFTSMREPLKSLAPYIDQIAASPEGRRQATRLMVEDPEHISPELVAQVMYGALGCEGFELLIDQALRFGWPLEPELVTCPVRIVWGTADRFLPWPGAAARYRDCFPTADWIELDGVGHCPQLEVPLEAAQLILGVTGAGMQSARAGA
jgi:pimeloyl-ACP methyl ester carboxylesterase